MSSSVVAFFVERSVARTSWSDIVGDGEGVSEGVSEGVPEGVLNVVDVSFSLINVSNAVMIDEGMEDSTSWCETGE